jgi:hypothetical protein
MLPSEADVGEVELAGFDFGRVFLVEVAQGDDLGVAEQRVAVEVELGVERHDALPLPSRFSGLISTSEASVSM